MADSILHEQFGAVMHAVSTVRGHLRPHRLDGLPNPVFLGRLVPWKTEERSPLLDSEDRFRAPRASMLMHVIDDAGRTVTGPDQ